ncbi:hypothetical protein [Caldicellulosiruptor acetigenus]|uniref:hypothetical protein n=1 Tax=Caldicellulosiruptor acetigenus TaxID=301953 RepID=UPI0004077843|nr:hypothetical protein [Caldicellulosiruptor acetigenus]WAM35887.1 hypothetical protein OTK01_002255 [Caldicellulosiruptor acetigenus]
MAYLIDWLGNQTQTSRKNQIQSIIQDFKQNQFLAPRQQQIKTAIQNFKQNQSNPSWGQFKLLDQQLSLAQSVKPTTTPTTKTTTPTTPSWGQFKVLDAQLNQPTSPQNLSYTATTNPSWGSFKVLDAQLSKQTPSAQSTQATAKTTSVATPTTKPLWYQDPSRKVTIYDFSSGTPKALGEGYIGPDNKTYVNVNGQWIWVRDLYPNADWTWNRDPQTGKMYIGIVPYKTPSNLESLLQAITPTQGLSQEFAKIPSTEELQKEAEAIYNPIYNQRAQEIKQAIEQAKSNVSNQMLSRGLARSSYAVDKIAEVEAQGQKQLEQLDEERRAQIANYIAQQREKAIERAMQAQQYNAELPYRNAQIAAALSNVLGAQQQQKQSAQLFPIQKETAQTELATKQTALQQSKELFPIQKEAAQTELATKKFELNVKEQMAPIEIKQATEQLRNMQLTNDKLAKMTPLELQQLDYQIKLLAQNYEKNKQIIPYEVKQAALEVDKAKLQNGILEQELKQQKINTDTLQKMSPYQIEKAYWDVQLLKQQYQQNNKKFPLELQAIESQLLTEAVRRAIMNDENFRNNELFKVELSLKGVQLQKAQKDLEAEMNKGIMDKALGAAITQCLKDITTNQKKLQEQAKNKKNKNATQPDLAVTPWEWLYQPAKDSQGRNIIDSKTKKPVTNGEVLAQAGLLQGFISFIQQYNSGLSDIEKIKIMSLE